MGHLVPPQGLDSKGEVAVTTPRPSKIAERAVARLREEAAIAVVATQRKDVQRALGKADRRLFTDAVQEFARYVDPTGAASTRPDMAQRNMTAMVYRPAGLNALQKRAKAAGESARDCMSESELEFLRVAERTTADLLRNGMAAGKTREQIKQDVKDHVDRLSAILQPSIDLARRYAEAVNEDLA